MIALIRTEGKEFTAGPTLTPQTFLGLPSLKRASKTDTTRAVEDDFALGNCLYFFAGHACPDFGDLVLVYNGDMADAYEGGATPFDTGGLHAHRIHYRSVPGESGAAYCKRHSQPLATWRSSADAFVREHFEWPTDYVLGKPPIRDDQSGDC